MTTAEIEVAKKKALAGGTPGVFSLDQLKALGQSGDMKTDWMAGGKPPPGALVSGGGRGTIDSSLNLPAGYYQLPGVEGAQYYDPHSGQVTPEFAAYAAGNIERNDLTGAPKALMAGQGDSGAVFRQGYDQLPSTIKTLNDIFAIGKDANGSYQDAQDRVLGLGRYQQFLTDKNGKQMRIQDVPGAAAPDPATAPYTDLSAKRVGAFDRLMKLTGQDRATLEKTLGGAVNANENPIAPGGTDGGYYAGTSETKSTLEDALASNYEKRASMWKGLQDQRAMRGLDINTGTSDAEKKRIYDTVSRITDPTQRAAYLSAQDPGNLTAELRTERYALRAGERDQISEYEKAHPQIEYNATGKYGQPAGTQTKLTTGGTTFTDTTTGRESFVGNVPKAIELVQPKYDRTGDIAHRVGGGVMGFLVGFATGNLPGAFLGAYTGAGGPTTKGSLNRPNDFGKMKTNQAHLMNLQEVGTAIAFARFTRSGAMFNTGPAATRQLTSISMGKVVGR